jgi:hypothetical protein
MPPLRRFTEKRPRPLHLIHDEAVVLQWAVLLTEKMKARKFALIIGNGRYDDSSLSRLTAPDVDVEGLAAVLKAPDVGHFDEVTTLLNEGCANVRKAIARFYDQRKRDDLLLLYFSGHGVKDEQGHLYLALRDTESTLLAGTAIETAFITGRMDRSVSKRQVLVLDCCHSGAFAAGAKAAQGVSVGTAEAFEGVGVGRVVLTATDSTQYAWEGDRIIGDDTQSSLFTHFLIDGLKTGAADRDGDGLVTVDELYDYVHEQVVTTTPRQTPHKWTYRQQGDIVLAENPYVTRTALPPEIEEAIGSKQTTLRLDGVRDLEVLLRGDHAGRSSASLAALKALARDDSRRVANAALAALKAYEEREAVTDKNLSAAAAATGPLPTDPDSARKLEAEIQQALAASPLRPAEAPPTPAEPLDALTSDIFISYAREDRDKAGALAAVLTARGWNVWWDRKIRPGEPFDVAIERELGTCRCAVVLWSGHSVNATWVRNEARRASRRRVLLPILIENVEMPLEFENLQAADLTSWNKAADHPELEAVFERIAALSPIPIDRLARAAVENARRDFKAGRCQEALSRLEQFQPAHDLVTRTLLELRAQLERTDRERAEAERVARDRAEAERVARERAEAERVARDRAEAERVARERAEAERVARDRAEAERVARERAEAERVARERAEAERVARKRAEAERVERERAAAVLRDAELTKPVERAAESPLEESHGWRLRPLHEVAEESAPQHAPDTGVAVEPPVQPRFSLTPRQLQMAGAASVVVLLLVGWLIVGLTRRPASRNDGPIANQASQNPTLVVPPAVAPSPAQTSPTPDRTPEPEPAPATPVDVGPPTPVPAPEVKEAPKAPVVAPGKTPASKDTSEFRTRARRQEQAGQRVEALATITDGLQIDSRDAVLRSLLDSLFRDAQNGMTRSKRDALAIEADTRADDKFNLATQKEREGTRQRRAGRTADATRSFWAATDHFKAATAEAKQIADAEAAVERRNKENQQRPGNPAPQTPPAVVELPKRPTIDNDAENRAVMQMLRQYEAAYNGRNMAQITTLFPTAPVDQVAREFANTRSHQLTIDLLDTAFSAVSTGWAGRALCRVVHEAVSNQNVSSRFVRSEIFTLEKTETAPWRIVRITVRD